MAEARRMGKSELFAHFAERFEVKRAMAREFFEELTMLSEKELKRSGEFVLPDMVKLVIQKRKARLGRNPATGEPIQIPARQQLLLDLTTLRRRQRSALSASASFSSPICRKRATGLEGICRRWIKNGVRCR